MRILFWKPTDNKFHWCWIPSRGRLVQQHHNNLPSGCAGIRAHSMGLSTSSRDPTPPTGHNQKWLQFVSMISQSLLEGFWGMGGIECALDLQSHGTTLGHDQKFQMWTGSCIIMRSLSVLGSICRWNSQIRRAHCLCNPECCVSSRENVRFSLFMQGMALQPSWIQLLLEAVLK